MVHWTSDPIECTNRNLIKKKEVGGEVFAVVETASSLLTPANWFNESNVQNLITKLTV